MATDVSWPDILPLPTFDGYGIEPLDAVLRTDMETGPARQRLLYTKVPERIAVRWRFTAIQYAMFRSWYAHKAQRGAEYFAITLLTGLGMVAHEVRFAGRGGTPYRAEPQRGSGGTRWIVTSMLEVRESPDLTEEALDLMIAEGGDIEGLLAEMGEFETLINAAIPGGSWA